MSSFTYSFLKWKCSVNSVSLITWKGFIQSGTTRWLSHVPHFSLQQFCSHDICLPVQPLVHIFCHDCSPCNIQKMYFVQNLNPAPASQLWMQFLLHSIKKIKWKISFTTRNQIDITRLEVLVIVTQRYITDIGKEWEKYSEKTAGLTFKYCKIWSIFISFGNKRPGSQWSYYWEFQNYYLLVMWDKMGSFTEYLHLIYGSCTTSLLNKHENDTLHILQFGHSPLHIIFLHNLVWFT